MPGETLTANDLRQKRATLWQENESILQDAKKEERDLTAEEREAFDRRDEEIEAMKADIDRLERHEQRQQEYEQSLELRAGKDDIDGRDQGDESDPDEIRKRDEKAREVRCKWLAYGVEGLTPEERALMPGPERIKGTGGMPSGRGFPIFRFSAAAPDAERRQARRDGRRPERGLELRDLKVGADPGQQTVPDEAMRQIEEALLAYGGMRRARTTIVRTSTGADLPIPTDNDTGNTGQLLGEAAEETNFTDPTMGQTVLSAFKYSSKFIRVSLEFLQDTILNADAYIARKLGTRIGRITNTHFTTGTGSSQPLGVENATAGKTTASTTAITYEELIDLVHSVDPSYRESAEFMFHDTTLRDLKKLADDQNRPLWLPGLAVREPDTLLGFPYVINQDVDQIAASAHSVLYGDFSKYWIRDVMDIMVMRLTERYAELGEVAFIAFSRHDGDLIDAGTNPIKYLRQPTS